MTDRDLWGTAALVVEPDPEVRALVRRVLAQRGHTVLEASTHREAVELLADSHLAIRILIVELVLPDLAGWHLARIIRAIEPGLPIIFMSAAEESAAAVMDHLGDVSWSFLRKPITERLLIDELRAQLGSVQLGCVGGSLD